MIFIYHLSCLPHLFLDEVWVSMVNILWLSNWSDHGMNSANRWPCKYAADHKSWNCTKYQECKYKVQICQKYCYKGAFILYKCFALGMICNPLGKPKVDWIIILLYNGCSPKPCITSLWLYGFTTGKLRNRSVVY